jgi:hypothetical protein
MWLDESSLSFVVSCERMFNSDTNTTKPATKEVFKLIRTGTTWDVVP